MMAPNKRKSEPAPSARRSSRRLAGREEDPAKKRAASVNYDEGASSGEGEPAPKKTKVTAKQPPKKKAAVKGAPAKKGSSGSATTNGARPRSQQQKQNGLDGAVVSEPAADGVSPPDQKNFWLMKAEPETRLERGVDVSFSIDDLAACSEPEPWDGIRNYVARNNLRAMKEGDLAFFYHSNCKEPGVVGTMEIVREHTPDLSAHDPKSAYYDPSSKPSDPKWSVVHVRFRGKLAAPVTLKDLREHGGAGRPLENMQVLKQTRLSVSRVTPAEWAAVEEIARTNAQKVAAD